MIATIISDAKKHYPVLLNELISIITPQYEAHLLIVHSAKADTQKNLKILIQKLLE